MRTQVSIRSRASGSTPQHPCQCSVRDWILVTTTSWSCGSTNLFWLIVSWMTGRSFCLARSQTRWMIALMISETAADRAAVVSTTARVVVTGSARAIGLLVLDPVLG